MIHQITQKMQFLCHISVGKWCAASKIDARSAERGEHCASVTVDVALKTLELILAKMYGKFTPMLKQSEIYAGCTVQGCHGENKKMETFRLLGSYGLHPMPYWFKVVLEKRRNHP